MIAISFGSGWFGLRVLGEDYLALCVHPLKEQRKPGENLKGKEELYEEAVLKLRFKNLEGLAPFKKMIEAIEEELKHRKVVEENPQLRLGA